VRILRIKQAEAALAAGRLNEACELLADADLRSHRQGQKLLSGLIERLIARGQEHLAAGRMPQALSDCQQASELGGNIEAAEDLRCRIAAALAGQNRARRVHSDALSAASRQADAGHLSLAEQLLAGAKQDSTRAGKVRREVETRRQEAADAVRRCRAAMDRDDQAGAVDELLTARAQRANNDALADLSAEVVAGCVEQARREFIRGRVDLAETLLARAALPCGAGPRIVELQRAVVECRQAIVAAEDGRLRQAGEMLRRARAILPDAGWIGEAVDAADRAAQAAETLRSGPLGILTGVDRAADAQCEPGRESDGKPDHQRRSGNAAQALPVLKPVAVAKGTTSGVPRRFVIQLDGAGSSLVFRGGRVTVGPISSADRPDLGLMADPNLPIVSIERTDEGDYFLAGEHPVEVNGRAVTGKLLADGDKIALSPRCRLRFRLPTPASATAVLELSTARLPQADIRRVILLDREVVIGPGGATHVRLDQLPGRAVLQLGGDRLTCRTDCSVTRDNRPLDPAAGIPLGIPVRIGPVGMVVDKA